jgi:hypothetical protein
MSSVTATSPCRSSSAASRAIGAAPSAPPDGLLGELRRIARVRGVMRASMSSTSGALRASIAYPTGVAPANRTADG